ncbi:hypothetical protein ACP4OV_007815 [Aristida adscensionis]
MGMGALCLVPATPPSCSCGAGAAPGPGPRRLAATPPSPAPRLQLAAGRRRRAGVARVGGGGGEGDGGKGGEAAFFGEDGVVEDMDGYLNYLSLEYDSVWDTKPAWCQPWTILLSGTLAVACSWVLLQSVVLTAGVSFVICAWCLVLEKLSENIHRRFQKVRQMHDQMRINSNAFLKRELTRPLLKANSSAFEAYTEMIAERRRKVASGAEDTYGMEKLQ